ncbi:MAG TPA: protein kinase, partial [Kofleriaceae bacterium]|nr:protein kinase [Kofleriaceae bacterium]
LEGRSLAEALRADGRFNIPRAVHVARGIGRALTAAHERGIVHRDLKPDNIFMVPDPDAALGERPKLLDFGIAKLTDIGLAGSATKTGAVMGTPTYMSPEQCKGIGEVDHRADLYSIGCILHELLVGRPPFTNLGAGELIGAHLYMQPETPTGLSAEMTALVMSLLAKDPALRPQTAKELGQRLTRIAQNQGWITATSPNAITADSLADLPIVPPRALSAAEDATLPSRPNHTPPVVLAADKPTTLSGAASQSVVDYPKRRRGLGIAAAAAITLAAGGVAIGIAMSGGSKPAKAPAKTPTSAVVPPSPRSDPPATPAAPVDPLPTIDAATTADSDATAGSAQPPAIDDTAKTVTTEPTTPKKLPPVRKLPKKDGGPPPAPAKPKTTLPIETDI